MIVGGKNLERTCLSCVVEEANAILCGQLTDNVSEVNGLTFSCATYNVSGEGTP